ncbi:MAG: hypothetical protein K6E75_02905 [Lachnospiraceae bacterium]|nr:hypothetical protein [Lachnospiraceae bacterium]
MRIQTKEEKRLREKLVAATKPAAETTAVAQVETAAVAQAAAAAAQVEAPGVVQVETAAVAQAGAAVIVRAAGKAAAGPGAATEGVVAAIRKPLIGAGKDGILTQNVS